MFAGLWRINFINLSDASMQCSCCCSTEDYMRTRACLRPLSLPGLLFLQSIWREKYKDISSMLVVNEVCSHFLLAN